MAEIKTENYSEKFKDLMDEESIYEFFLKMQNILQKYSKKMKDSEDHINYIIVFTFFVFSFIYFTTDFSHNIV